MSVKVQIRNDEPAGDHGKNGSLGAGLQTLSPTALLVTVPAAGGQVPLDVRTIIFTLRVVKHWNGCSARLWDFCP